MALFLMRKKITSGLKLLGDSGASYVVILLINHPGGVSQTPCSGEDPDQVISDPRIDAASTQTIPGEAQASAIGPIIMFYGLHFATRPPCYRRLQQLICQRASALLARQHDSNDCWWGQVSSGFAN